jgi:hypothetical protein
VPRFREASRTAAAALGLFCINAVLMWRLFRIPYTQYMGSIEAAYVGLARYIVAHFPHLAWFPLWYGGIPYPDTYPPLLHFTVAGVAAAARISPALAYHIVTAVVYALGPVTVFWAAWRLGAGRVPAWLAGLGYSLVSPTCFLVREVRAGSGGWFGARRLTTLLPNGEGPHLTSLMFLPLAIALLHVALTKRRPVYYVLAGLALAATVLSNWIGAFALALGAGAYLFAGFAARPVRQWLTAAGLACYAYLIALPFVAPSIVATIRANAPLVGVRFESGPTHLAIVAVFAAGFLVLAWAMRHAPLAAPARFGILFFYATAFIALAGYWVNFSLLPQPQRYHLEMDLAFWLAMALIAGPAYARLPRRVVLIVVCALALAAVPIWIYQLHRTRGMEKPIDIQSTAEYRVSHWLGDHLPGRRVFAPGTIGFWMNAFSDTPMMTGGFDNGERNVLLQDIIFQEYFGDSLEVGLGWLKAFGVDAVVGGDPTSGEVYHPYAHPEKWHSLPVLWRDQTEVVYAVPRGSCSLAHAVRAADLVRETPAAYELKAVRSYLAALDDPALPPADFRWTGTGSARIEANLRPEHLLSVQVTFDEGWHASVNGAPRRIWSDKLGQIVVEPRCDGACTVDLDYDGGTEMRLARPASVLALVSGGVWIVLGRIRWRKRLDLATAKLKLIRYASHCRDLFSSLWCKLLSSLWHSPLPWLSVSLFAINALVAAPLFRTEYLSQRGTVEGLFVSYARYARDHWPDLGWCRFWYDGMPFQSAYPPALHLAVAGVSFLGHLNIGLAFHIVVALIYSLGPVTLFWMAARLTGSVRWSFYAALLYSLTSPSAALVPAIRHDLGSLFWARRLHTPVAWGDSPHVCSLTLIPLAILILDLALEKRRPTWYVFAALALAAVALTNWPGAIVMACATVAYWLAVPEGGRLRRLARIIGISALAYAIAMPWMPPSTIIKTQANVQVLESANKFGLRHLAYLALAAICTWLLLRILSAARAPRHLRFFLLFSLYMAAITLGWYWFGVTLLAQPGRFHLAMEMGLALSAVFAVRLLCRRWALLRWPLAVAFALVCITQFFVYRTYASRLIQGTDVTRTSEYKTALWFDRHIRGSRVMVPGSTAFWLNAFTDTPQLTGCCSQSVLTQIIPTADYGISTDQGAGNRAVENSLRWFKALGVRAVAVSGPRSTEVYKTFLHPHKFEGHLSALWRDGDDVIYEVPWRHYSIAHALEPADLVQRTPANGVDTMPLVPYVEAFERPEAPQLDVRWPDNETIVVTGSLRPGQVVSVQESAHPGWHAAVNGSPRRVYADKLGQLTVVPECYGNCTITLHYDGGAEMIAAHWIRRAAIAGSLFWMLISLWPRIRILLGSIRWRKRSDSATTN